MKTLFQKFNLAPLTETVRQRNKVGFRILPVNLLVISFIFFFSALDFSAAQQPLAPPTQFAPPAYSGQAVPAAGPLMPTQFREQVTPEEPQLDHSRPVQQPNPFSVRIKDITTIAGRSTNRVDGFGLVTGLKGTGGKSQATQQFARNLMLNRGIRIELQPTQSLSVVYISAEVPPHFQPGEKLSATVSVWDDANSLFGGMLIPTSLMGVDGTVYAVAGGALTIGGFSAAGAGGSVKKNHDTSGRVEAQMVAAICEGPEFKNNRIKLLLRNKDDSTAYRIATEINQYFPRVARALNSGTVDVNIPRSFDPMAFLVIIENFRVVPDHRARVVINEKTGTITVGQDVKISRVMFAKDNLIITTSETPVTSQPAPQSFGQTVVLPRTQIQATEQGGRYNILNDNITVSDLAAALNMLGVTPQDLISVFQSIRDEGSLQAELIVQ